MLMATLSQAKSIATKIQNIEIKSQCPIQTLAFLILSWSQPRSRINRALSRAQSFFLADWRLS